MSDSTNGTPKDVMAATLASYLYDRTAGSKVTGRKALLKLPSTSDDKELMAALLDEIGTEEASPALLKLSVVHGRKDKYYYDSTIMTRQYAELDSLLEDKDILVTIATVTRSDSHLYPRPTQFSKLRKTPFYFSEDEILGAAARMKDEADYTDIKVATASNGNSAFYSTKHLSDRYAQSLLELIEVDEEKNP